MEVKLPILTHICSEGLVIIFYIQVLKQQRMKWGICLDYNMGIPRVCLT